MNAISHSKAYDKYMFLFLILTKTDCYYANFTTDCYYPK